MSVGTETHALSEAIEAVVAPVVRAHGLTLVDVDLRGGGGRSTLRFFIDKPGGVSIADCQRFSEEVGDLLDVANLLTGRYDLEVSSPGLDRELKKEHELRWAVGKRVRVWTREPVDGRRELVGRLAGIGEQSLTLADADDRREIPRVFVAKVRLEVDLRGSA